MATINDPQITIQNVNLKIDPVVKESAESVLANMGLSMSSYVGMCLRQLAQNREIPFIQKADPEFWAAEYRAYKAKRIIDSLDIASFVHLCRVIIESITEINSSLTASMSVLKLYCAASETTKLDSAASELTKSAVAYIESCGTIKFSNSIETSREEIRILSESIATFERFIAAAALGKDIPGFEDIAKCRENLESLTDVILDLCYEIVNKDAVRFQELLYSRFDFETPEDFEKEITREDSVFYVDELFSYVIDAYEANPASIVLRYTGQVGGSAVDMSLSKASMARKMLSETKFGFEYGGDNSKIDVLGNALGNVAALAMANESN